MTTKKADIDWEEIQRDYRIGLKTLREIAKDGGVSHVAIQKRAKNEGWPRDLQAKIKAKSIEKVNRAQVTRTVTSSISVTENEIVEAVSDAAAKVEELNRRDVDLGLRVSRNQLEALAVISSKDAAAELEWVRTTAMNAKLDEGQNPESVARAMSFFDYVVSVPGLAKVSKDIAASHGVYIPMQRKIFKLDEEGDRNQAAVDALMAKINASAD
jgi:hypothetical protein